MNAPENIETYLETAVEAARLGGEILMRFRGKAISQEKSPRDLVTDADLASQAAISKLIGDHFPTHAFLGEESTKAERDAAVACKRRIWVVDPLDGTANFVHGLQNFAVSIALVEGSRILLGVVFDPTVDSLYWATQESPAMLDGKATHNGKMLLDGKKIACSRCESLDQAMVACSFPVGVRRTDPEVEQFLRVLERCQSLRRLGSAALNLCYVAQGCLDAYWARTIQPWDVAAGCLIAQRAGAKLSGISGQAFDLWNPHLLVSCGNGLHGEILRCFSE